VGRHRWSGRRKASANFRDYSRVIPAAKRRSQRGGGANTAGNAQNERLLLFWRGQLYGKTGPGM